MRMNFNKISSTHFSQYLHRLETWIPKEIFFYRSRSILIEYFIYMISMLNERARANLGGKIN